MTDWLAYSGTGRPDADVSGRTLPAAPPWRQFDGVVDGDVALAATKSGFRSETFQATAEDVEMVNAALYLRRPLLVTGKPGTGKSSLAHSVARELQLGDVLHWPITSRSTLKDGLYEYDAVARLQDASPNLGSWSTERDLNDHENAIEDHSDVGRYLTLGPLGTALLPRIRPRVLIIDELDKSDIDLPNDLLNVFEEGYYTIPELVRWRDRRSEMRVMTADVGDSTVVRQGIVRCHEFPLVIITSNGEREFPVAFLRRCLRLEMQEPDKSRIQAIVAAHLGDTTEKAGWLIDQFLRRRDEGELATDQLLNAVYLVQHGLAPSRKDRDSLARLLLPHLDAAATE